jgi:oligosaccharide reducing-end xylanase
VLRLWKIVPVSCLAQRHGEATQELGAFDMMDHNFYDADPWQTTWASTFAAFFTGQGASYIDAYTPAGMPEQGSHSPHIVACNATLGFGVPASVGAPFVQELWNLPIPTGTYRYYDGMLYVLALLHVSGTFHIWY